MIAFSLAVRMTSPILARSVSSSLSTAMATNFNWADSGWFKKIRASSKPKSPQFSPSSCSMSSIKRSKFCTSREMVQARIGAGSGCKLATLDITTVLPKAALGPAALPGRLGQSRTSGLDLKERCRWSWARLGPKDRQSAIFGGLFPQVGNETARRMGRAEGQRGRQPPELGSTCVTTTVVRGWGRSARLLVIDVFT